MIFLVLPFGLSFDIQLRNPKMTSMQFIVVDLETTGLDSKTDAIIEVALLRIDETGKELGRYETLINPGFAIKEDITYITGITNEDLVNAPVFSAVRNTLAEFL